MSRPIKAGLDYFPLDVHVDEKIELIEAKHGLVGFGITIKLFQNIYQNSYFLKVTEDLLLLLSKRISADINLVNAVINDGIKWGLFDEQLYRTQSVLTSKGLQKRYVEATKRRKEVEFIKEYILIGDVETLYSDRVIVNIKSINADNNPKKENNNSQSKVKESKEDIYTRVVTYLNRKANSKFNPKTKTTQKLIKARLNEEFTPEDFKAVIDFQCSKWLADPEMIDYLRPQTLFSNKFESYLNAARRKPISVCELKPKPKTIEERKQEEMESFGRLVTDWDEIERQMVS